MLQDFGVKHINSIISSIKKCYSKNLFSLFISLKKFNNNINTQLYYCEYVHFVEILTNYSFTVTEVHES